MNMQRTVLVTGANSLLGTHTICELLASGYAVRGLLRSRNSYVGPTDPALELIEGSFADADTLRGAVKGCEYVVHCAAKTGQSGDYASFESINVAATERLVKIACEHGVKRVVNVASANVFAYGSKENPGDESAPMTYPFTESAYARSKYEALLRLRKFHGWIEIVTVCPTFMIGKWDSRPSSGRIILMGFGRGLMFCPPGGKNFVPASDVAKGIVAALTHGRDGERYLLSGENLSYKEFYRSLAEQGGYRQRLVRVPSCVLTCAGAVGDLLAKIGVRSEISSVNMRILCVGNYYQNEKSTRELGLHYRPVAEAVSEAVEWFGQRGMLPDGTSGKK